MTIPIEITELIKSSGNSFHAKVARQFRDAGWHVVLSPYYLDQSQGKAREIDLIVEKLWPVTKDFGELAGNIIVRLFVECKYVPSHAVFWFSDKEMRSAEKLVCTGSPFRMDNTVTKDHHYLSESPKVAKLFTSSKSKAPENDPFYRALNQALNGMVSLRGNQTSIPHEQRKGKSNIAVLDFPVIVCNSFSKMYRTDFYDETEPEKIESNFQFEVRYAYVNRQQQQVEEYFLLDFVEYRKLDLLLKAIEIDAKRCVHLAY